MSINVCDTLNIYENHGVTINSAGLHSDLFWKLNMFCICVLAVAGLACPYMLSMSKVFKNLQKVQLCGGGV